MKSIIAISIIALLSIGCNQPSSEAEEQSIVTHEISEAAASYILNELCNFSEFTNDEVNHCAADKAVWLTLYLNSSDLLPDQFESIYHRELYILHEMYYMIDDFSCGYINDFSPPSWGCILNIACNESRGCASDNRRSTDNDYYLTADEYRALLLEHDGITVSI